jgi:TP901 family phage tail tape measure protein
MAETMQELMIRIAAKIDDLQAKLEQAQTGISGIADHTKAKSKQMSTDWLDVTKAIAVWELGVEKAKQIMMEMVDEAIKMQSAMTHMQMITGANAEQMDEYGDIARTTGIKLGFMGSQTAEAMELLMKDGIQSAAAIKTVLVPSLELARATGISAAQSTKLVTDSLKSWGLGLEEAGNVANTYLAVLKKTHLTQEDLNTIIKVAGPSARAYGVSIQDLTTLFAGFEGISVSADRGAIAYRMSMNNLTKSFNDEGEAVNKAGKTLLEHGINAQRLSELMKNPVEMLKVFHDANISAGDAQQIFGQRTWQVMYNLMESQKVLNKAKEDVGGFMNTTQAANREMHTWAGSIALFKAEIMGMGAVLTERVFPAIAKFGAILEQINLWLKKNATESVNFGTIMFGSIGGTIEKIVDKWIHLGNTSKVVHDSMTNDVKKLEQPFKGVQAAAAGMDDIFATNAETLKATREKMIETEKQFHERLFAMSEKSVIDRQEATKREIDDWRKKGIEETDLSKLRAELIKKNNKEVTDDLYKKLKESASWEKANHLERLAMLKSWRENSINNHEAIRVSEKDLAEYQKKSAEDVYHAYEAVLMKPMDEGFKSLFDGIKAGHADIGKAAETVARASGKAIVEALAKQADAAVATGIAQAFSQGGLIGLAANAGAIALATAQALAVHAIAASLAGGGIASRPTLAVVGDRPEGPEVVAGLDQLQDMLRPRNTDSGSQTAGENPDKMAAGSTTNVTLNYNHSPLYSSASPAEARKAGMEITRVLQQFGFGLAKA